MTLITCTRPSTLANALDDKSGLMPYVAATTLKTIRDNPDLATRLSLTKGDSWRDFKPLYEEAERRGGGREASDGTNIHMVVEAIHSGTDVSAIPAEVRRDGEAVVRTIEDLGMRIGLTEQFLVTDDPDLPETCAGTTDLVLQARDGSFLIGDTKSVGSHTDGRYGAVKWGIQTATYAHGRPYVGTVTRDRWGRPQINTDDIRDWSFGALRTDVAVVFEVERGSGTVKVHWIDVAAGWALAQLACEVRAARKAPGVLRGAL